jgi:hypothetical protein
MRTWSLLRRATAGAALLTALLGASLPAGHADTRWEHASAATTADTHWGD